MSPLQKGPGSIRKNMGELMKGVQSPARKKAISTIAKKNNIPRKESMYKQAFAISKSQARKK